MHTVIIGSRDDVRVKLFQRALLQSGHPPAVIADYRAIIRGNLHLSSIIQPGMLVRIESPGKNEDTNLALLALGAEEPDEDGEYLRVVPSVNSSKGLIAASRQWYLGLRSFMRLVAEQLKDCPPHHLINHPDDIVMMFDKRACHAFLQAGGISVPPALPCIRNFDELEQTMHTRGVRRVFIKLAHGSSASGVIAYQTNGSEHRATAAIEMVTEGGRTQLFNTRHVQTYHLHAQIATLINTLCQHRIHVENWIPKARMGNKAFDLRVVVIGGKPAHTVARLSSTPMTNLHLLNERRDRQAVIDWVGLKHFEEAMALCARTMTLFPRSLYAGIDLLIAPGFQKHYIIEVNAFGDLLHDTLFEGLDTYSLEIRKVTCG